MKQIVLAAAALVLASALSPALAQQRGPAGAPVPFNMTLSNNTPLAFGMDVDQTARALGQPLRYVRGR